MSGRQYVSTAEVSAALGVSVNTIKRWVDEGILPAHKTVGGHRKLLLADVVRIVRTGNFPHLDLTRLYGPAFQSPASEPQALVAPLLAALKQRDIAATRSLIHDAYRSGLAIETLADAVIAPAMSELGKEWETGQIDVLHEHSGTQTCAAVLYELKALLEDHAQQGPLAVGGTPEHDPYLLATLLAEMVLLDAGWQVIHLGPNTPLTAFRRALGEFQPRLIWLSISFLADVPQFLREYLSLTGEARQRGIAVAVGGRALTGELRAAMPFTLCGEGLTALMGLADSLYPRPGQPKRGRPPQTRAAQP